MQSYWWVWFPGIEKRILEHVNISFEGFQVKIAEICRSYDNSHNYYHMRMVTRNSVQKWIELRNSTTVNGFRAPK